MGCLAIELAKKRTELELMTRTALLGTMLNGVDVHDRQDGPSAKSAEDAPSEV